MSKIDEKADELTELRIELGEIEMDVMTNFTLADAIREGSKVSIHNTEDWGDGDTACALTAGVISAVSRGYL